MCGRLPVLLGLLPVRARCLGSAANSSLVCLALSCCCRVHGAACILATTAPSRCTLTREKKGYSGVTTYASEAWAPLSAESDCLGSGEDDIDREGRCGHFRWLVSQFSLHVAG